MKTLQYTLMTLALAAAPATLVLGASPTVLHAQDGWWDWTLRELSIRVDLGGPAAHRAVPDVVRIPAPRYDAGVRGRARRAKARGPAFCRSGAGHPVFGRRWCVDKGFGLPARAHPPLRWERRYWEGNLPHSRTRHRGGTLGRGELISVLGPAVYGRLDRQRARLGGRHALSGRWIRPHGSSIVLQVRAGRLAVAELTDFGADGWIDVVLVAGR